MKKPLLIIAIFLVSAGVLHATDTIVDSYAESNRNWSENLSSVGATARGQAFTNSVASTPITKASLHLAKTGSPTGTMVAKLYALGGSFGTNGAPTGSALATSDTVNTSVLSTSYALVDFTFTGAQQYSMAAANYVIVLEYSGGNDSNRVEWGDDNSSPTHPGNGSYFYGGSWTGINSIDHIFYVYSQAATVASSFGDIILFGDW